MLLSGFFIIGFSCCPSSAFQTTNKNPVHPGILISASSLISVQLLNVATFCRSVHGMPESVPRHPEFHGVDPG